jgi:hypothetical protein
MDSRALDRIVKFDMRTVEYWTGSRQNIGQEDNRKLDRKRTGNENTRTNQCWKENH